MEVADVRELLTNQNPEAILWKGLDSCLIGMSTDNKAVYDISKIISYFEQDMGLTTEEAIDYVEYNILGAYVGNYTPIHIYSLLSHHI